jgi:uncharacterized membrane protein YhaH (DUF805 family)
MDIKHLLFGFQGRIRRSEWWVAELCVFGAAIFIGPIIFLPIILFAVAARHAGAGDVVAISLLGFALLALLLLALWINIAVGVKRLHDQDLSGWMMLIAFIPGIGLFFRIICLGCIDGTMGRNRYGPSSKYPESVATTFT